MEVKVKKQFFDYEIEAPRFVGQEFEMSEKRYEEPAKNLLDNHGVDVKDVVEVVKKKAGEASPAK